MRLNSVIFGAALILSFGAGYLTARRNVLFPPVVGREVPVAIETGKNPSSSALQTAALPDARASLAGLSYDQIKQRTVLALREPDRILRTKAWLEILAGMTRENGKAIADGLMERFRAGGDTKEAGQQLQFREGQVYGLDAITKLPSEPNGKVDWVTQNTIKGWASVDPLATKAWIDSLEPGQAQTSMRSNWLEGLSQSTPAVIASVFDDLPGSDQRALLGGLMNGIFDQNGIQGMRDWFDSHHSKLDGSATSSAFVSITSRMAQIDGKSEEAAAFLRSNASSPFFTPKHSRHLPTGPQSQRPESVWTS